MILTKVLFVTFLLTSTLHAAPKAALWPLWQAHTEVASLYVDYSPWRQFLARHLRVKEGLVNLVDYGTVAETEKVALEKFLSDLQQIPVSKLTRPQQKAYWINLYNAGTVNLILDHYPVDSILDIDISPGWFSNGPWGKKLFSIEGTALSLDDIEHRILRPIWRDPRIHYALNCASIGCPNLQSEPFMTKNIEVLLDRAAREFITHSRGVDLTGGKLKVSSIYVWFKEDFGGTDHRIIDHITQYADQHLARELRKIEKIADHEYDWSLNKT